MGLVAALLVPSHAAPARAGWLPGGDNIDYIGHGTRLAQLRYDSAVRPESDTTCLVLVVSQAANCCCLSDLMRLYASGNVQHIPIPAVPGLRDAIPGAQGAVLALLGCADLHLFRILPDGTLDPAWPSGGVGVGAAGGPGSAALVPDDAGGAFVAWNIVASGGASLDVKVQHVTATGAVAAPGGVSAVTPVAARRLGGIVPDGNGGAIVVFEDDRNPAASADLYAQRVDGALTRLWGDEGAAVCTAAFTQQGPVAIPDGAGGAYVLWKDLGGGSVGQALYATRLGADGSPAAGWPSGGLLVRPGIALYQYHLASAGAAGAIVSSHDWPQPGPAYLHLDRLEAAGAADTLWEPTVFQSYESSSDLVPDGSDGVFLTWLEWPNEYVFALHIGPDGQPAPGWGPGGFRVDADRDPGPHGYVTQGRLSLACVAPGVAFEVFSQQIHPWCGLNEVCYDAYLYAQLLVPEGPVAVLASLVSADASEGRVRLAWWVSTREPVTVHRLQDGGGWVALGQVQPDPAGRVTFEDDAVSPGARYGYRLAFAGASGPAYAGEVWVDVPTRAALALLGPRPNPASEGLTVAFSLFDDAPATLELFDPLGRCLERRQVGALGAGNHTLQLDAAGRLAPGLYLVRLTRGPRTLTARAAVIR